jgi:hypothetical protein
MSGLTHPAVGAGAAVLGTRVVADHATGPVAKVASVASGMLPFTGVAVGIYLAIGLGLIVAGFILRRVGKEA